MAPSLTERIALPGPKKILACDGGGILGLASVEILAQLEQDLRRLCGDPKLLLGDWFDFVCGTSTGAILAACLAAGMSTADLRSFYVNSGAQMFETASILRRLHYKYDADPLAKMIQRELNRALGLDPDGPAATLGDPRLRSMLMMVLRNHSTDSPWPVSNNPAAKYNDRRRPDCNLNLPLWQLVRASTAAPTYFPPEVVTFAPGTEREYNFVFVDGGVTTYNNPAFLAFQMATAEPYKVGWATGVDRLLIVSVGTGNAAKERLNLRTRDLHLLHYAASVPSALMNAASAGWDMTCRLLGECRFGLPIDREYGDMVLKPGAGTYPETSNTTVPKAFAYVRYDPDVSSTGLAGLGLSHISPGHVQELDSIEHIDAIQLVGQEFAKRFVQTERHLQGFLPI
jgi:patatin-like phospholipase/acyl hydrolase